MRDKKKEMGKKSELRWIQSLRPLSGPIHTHKSLKIRVKKELYIKSSLFCDLFYQETHLLSSLDVECDLP